MSCSVTEPGDDDAAYTSADDSLSSVALEEAQDDSLSSIALEEAQQWEYALDEENLDDSYAMQVTQLISTV